MVHSHNCRDVFISLKYVAMPYLPNNHLICSESSFTYRITTEILFNISFSGDPSDVSMKLHVPVNKKNTMGPVHKIKCEECEALYVGETERSLKAGFNEQRQPSSSTSEVAKYIHVDQDR